MKTYYVSEASQDGQVSFPFPLKQDFPEILLPEGLSGKELGELTCGFVLEVKKRVVELAREGCPKDTLAFCRIMLERPDLSQSFIEKLVDFDL